MGLFNREKKSCPLCGSELKFLGGKVLGDGTTICDACEEKLRLFYQTGFEEKTDAFGNVVYQSNGYVSKKLVDDMSSISIDEAKAAMAEIDKRAAQLAEEFGGKYSSVFTVGSDSFCIAPKALEVGLKRAKLLKDATVVDGLAVTGSFDKDEEVIIVVNGVEKKARVIEAHKKDVSDFATILRANMKQGFSQGTNGYLIISTDSPIPAGSVIAK